MQSFSTVAKSSSRINRGPAGDPVRKTMPMSAFAPPTALRSAGNCLPFIGGICQDFLRNVTAHPFCGHENADGLPVIGNLKHNQYNQSGNIEPIPPVFN